MAVFPSIIPQYSLVETDQYGTLITDLWGKERRRNLWGPKKAFYLKFEALSLGDARSIMDFFVARRGNYESFTWINPLDNVSYTVRFSEASLKREEIANEIFNIEFSLEEVL